MEIKRALGSDGDVPPLILLLWHVQQMFLVATWGFVHLFTGPENTLEVTYGHLM